MTYIQIFKSSQRWVKHYIFTVEEIHASHTTTYTLFTSSSLMDYLLRKKLFFYYGFPRYNIQSPLTRVVFETTTNYRVPKEIVDIIICLLYTSPSPRDS